LKRITEKEPRFYRETVGLQQKLAYVGHLL